MTEYTDPEIRLIQQFSNDWKVLISHLSPHKLFGTLAWDAFIENRTGPEVEALRRVCAALNGGTVRRYTPEFDVLCKFHEREETPQTPEDEETRFHDQLGIYEPGMSVTVTDGCVILRTDNSVSTFHEVIPEHNHSYGTLIRDAETKNVIGIELPLDRVKRRHLVVQSDAPVRVNDGFLKGE